MTSQTRCSMSASYSPNMDGFHSSWYSPEIASAKFLGSMATRCAAARCAWYSPSRVGGWEARPDGRGGSRESGSEVAYTDLCRKGISSALTMTNCEWSSSRLSGTASPPCWRRSLSFSSSEFVSDSDMLSLPTSSSFLLLPFLPLPLPLRLFLLLLPLLLLLRRWRCRSRW